MKIIGCAYRRWALKILEYIEESLEVDMLIIKDPEGISMDDFDEYSPAMVLFYGWSWMVPEEITSKYLCLCMHPSPLPKYRGGSPIQNQIMNGETQSALSIFRMNGKVDAGELWGQEPLSLEGQLWEILERMSNIGSFMTTKLLSDFEAEKLEFRPQRGEETVFVRISPDNSEITRDEVALAPARYLYNKIRGLQDPYPNAFIVCGDGQKLFLTEATCED